MTQQHDARSTTDAATATAAANASASAAPAAVGGPGSSSVKRYDENPEAKTALESSVTGRAEASKEKPRAHQDLVPHTTMMTRLVDLIYGGSTSSSVQSNASGVGSHHRSPRVAEDGSAEALLSLMQSVQASRARELAQTEAYKLGESQSRKYLRDQEEESSGGEIGDANSDGEDTSGKRTPRTKKRKSTHTVRKQEKAVLVDEIKVLEDRLKLLRGQVFLPPKDSEGNEVDPSVTNALLRQTVYEQQLSFAVGRSLLSQYMTQETSSPIHSYLHLGRDMAQRRTQLFDLKTTFLAQSKTFIEQRSKMLDLKRHHAVVERFETNSGDACCVRFYVDQFPNFSVRAIHDATQFFVGNLEMSITDSLGHITIREDDDSGDPSLSQHRLVVAGGFGIIVETNIVIFTHFNEKENYGIAAVTSVDEDDLHPYRPHERIRQDVIGVSLITEHEGVVIVRRWAHMRMRKSKHVQLPEFVLHAARDNLGNWGDAMMNFVRARLYATSTQATS